MVCYGCGQGERELTAYEYEEEHELEFMGEEPEISSCSHAYQFVEPVQSKGPEVYLERWKCINCSHERILEFNVGVRYW